MLSQAEVAACIPYRKRKINGLHPASCAYGRSLHCGVTSHISYSGKLAIAMRRIDVASDSHFSVDQDQLRELPPRIPAATLSGSLTSAATAAIVDDVIRERIKVLFVSPERLASASFQRLFQPKWNKETNSHQRPFPTVPLLCVDEAHCLSQVCSLKHGVESSMPFESNSISSLNIKSCSLFVTVGT